MRPPSEESPCSGAGCLVHPKGGGADTVLCRRDRKPEAGERQSPGSRIQPRRAVRQPGGSAGITSIHAVSVP